MIWIWAGFILFVLAMLALDLGVFHRILGALVMRGVMIAIGAELVARYHWILYVFGVFLLVTAVKMLMLTEHTDPSRSVVIRWTKKLFPVTEGFHGEHFVVRANSTNALEGPVPGTPAQMDTAVAEARPGTLMLTPLAVALVMVETTDVIFAVDSIPAIFAITADPFLSSRATSSRFSGCAVCILPLPASSTSYAT